MEDKGEGLERWLQGGCRSIRIGVEGEVGLGGTAKKVNFGTGGRESDVNHLQDGLVGVGIQDWSGKVHNQLSVDHGAVRGDEDCCLGFGRHFGCTSSTSLDQVAESGNRGSGCGEGALDL